MYGREVFNCMNVQSNISMQPMNVALYKASSL